jgi:hypothetical protein
VRIDDGPAGQVVSRLPWTFTTPLIVEPLRTIQGSTRFTEEQLRVRQFMSNRSRSVQHAATFRAA